MRFPQGTIVALNNTDACNTVKNTSPIILVFSVRYLLKISNTFWPDKILIRAGFPFEKEIELASLQRLSLDFFMAYAPNTRFLRPRMLRF